MRIFAFLLFLVFLVFAIFARWTYVCEIRQMCGDSGPDSLADVRLNNLMLRNENGDTLLYGYDQFAFDSTSLSLRLNENNRQFLDTLVDLMQADTTQRLTITGFYLPDETLAPGFFENMGIGRADAIRRLLTAMGLAEDDITIDHGIRTDSTLREPAEFKLYTYSGLPEEFATTAYTFTNMTFSDANFAFDSDEFRPGEPFKLYADSVRTYLELNPAKGMTIVGHTDDIGRSGYNVDLGLRRAKSAREYFRDMGVAADIAVDSKGETEPVAPNNSAPNRQKNRRVNFIIE
ncbi:MAG: OmpA family protein [Lewinella sp.]|nr:OmpA family protein [Lewinella sp.]